MIDTPNPQLLVAIVAVAVIGAACGDKPSSSADPAASSAADPRPHGSNRHPGLPGNGWTVDRARGRGAPAASFGPSYDSVGTTG